MRRQKRRRPVRRAISHVNSKEEHGGNALLTEEIQPSVTSGELNAENSPNLRNKRKGERRDEAPNKRRKMERSESRKDGANQNIHLASKRPGSYKMESRPTKRMKVEDIEGKADDVSSMSLNTDMEQLSKTAEPPIIVTGPESFTFHKILGQGAYGKVMLATHPACQKQVAVKMVKKRLLIDDSRDDVLIERQVLEATGKSPFFTRAYATFQTEDYIFYAMEYLSGGDLSDFITAHAPLPIPVIRFFAAEIICGLQFLHSRGIIHRDIKPANIMLDSAGHVKIADFGLAVMNVFGEKKISELAGTRKYMAPEMILKKPYNAAVDWFSAGVILYEMATGKYPFGASKKIGNITKSLIKCNPSYPKELNPQLRDVIEQLLNKSPEARQVAAHNIREHPFFMEINWADLEEAITCPPFQLKTPPVMTSEKMDKVLSSSEAKKPPMAERDEKLFCGFSFVSSGWQVIKPTQTPAVPQRRTFGTIVKETFHRIWRSIKRRK